MNHSNQVIGVRIPIDTWVRYVIKNFPDCDFVKKVVYKSSRTAEQKEFLEKFLSDDTLTLTTKNVDLEEYAIDMKCEVLYEDFKFELQNYQLDIEKTEDYVIGLPVMEKLTDCVPIDEYIKLVQKVSKDVAVVVEKNEVFKNYPICMHSLPVDSQSVVADMLVNNFGSRLTA